MKGRVGTVLAGVVLLGVVLGEVGAQVVGVGERTCAAEEANGDLGISGLDCRGDCTLTMDEMGEERSWSFSVEPVVTGVREGSPSDGVLRPGDAIVAVDGVLITTQEGGRRFASIEPGQEVRVRFRRGGALAEALLVADAACPVVVPAPPSPLPRAPASVTVAPPAVAGVRVGRLAPPPRPDTVPPDTLGRAGVAEVLVAPRVLVRPAEVAAMGIAPLDSTRAVGVAADTLGRAVSAPRPDTGRVIGIRGDTLRVGDTAVAAPVPRGVLEAPPPPPGGRIGISFSCGPCWISSDERGRHYAFSGPIEVTAVEAGGPADRAGVQLGDQITAVNGDPIGSAEGSEAFSRLTPGVPVMLTLVKRDGRVRSVTVTPEGRGEGTAVGRAAAARAEAEVPPAPAKARVPERPGRAGEPQPTVGAPGGGRARVPQTGLDAPPDLPLRYTGALGAVEIEVRGDPVTVSEVGGARTILIRSEGLWIRLRIPRGS